MQGEDASTLMATADAMAHRRSAKAVEIAALVLICSMATIIRLFSVRHARRNGTACDEIVSVERWFHQEQKETKGGVEVA